MIERKRIDFFAAAFGSPYRLLLSCVLVCCLWLVGQRADDLKRPYHYYIFMHEYFNLDSHAIGAVCLSPFRPQGTPPSHRFLGQSNFLVIAVTSSSANHRSGLRLPRTFQRQAPIVPEKPLSSLFFVSTWPTYNDDSSDSSDSTKAQASTSQQPLNPFETLHATNI